MRQRHVVDLPRGQLSGAEASLHLQHLGYTRYPEVLSVWCSRDNGCVYELLRWVQGKQLCHSDCSCVMHLHQSG